MLDDLVGALIGGLIGDAIQGGLTRGRARRKAKRYIGGEKIRFRAYLKYDNDDRPRRGRLIVTPGSEKASWTPWPRWRKPAVELVLLGGKGNPAAPANWRVPAHGWRVRIGTDDVATLLLERTYLAAFAPIVSLGAIPASSRRRRKRR